MVEVEAGQPSVDVKLPATHGRWYQVSATNLKGDYDGIISREIYFS